MPTDPSTGSGYNLARLEAVAQRHLNAATTDRDRCLSALALLAIRRYRTRQQQASSGEVTTRVAASPVGASGAPIPPSIPLPGPDRAGDSLSPVTLPSEIPVIVSSAATPARRKGQRA